MNEEKKSQILDYILLVPIFCYSWTNSGEEEEKYYLYGLN